LLSFLSLYTVLFIVLLFALASSHKNQAPPILLDLSPKFAYPFFVLPPFSLLPWMLSCVLISYALFRLGSLSP
jgi:hypothetical protein